MTIAAAIPILWTRDLLLIAVFCRLDNCPESALRVFIETTAPCSNCTNLGWEIVLKPDAFLLPAVHSLLSACTRRGTLRIPRFLRLLWPRLRPLPIVALHLPSCLFGRPHIPIRPSLSIKQPKRLEVRLIPIRAYHDCKKYFIVANCKDHRPVLRYVSIKLLISSVNWCAVSLAVALACCAIKPTRQSFLAL